MLGNNLISLRRMKKMTQEDLADKLGVSRQTISKWETGDSIPDMEMGMKLADILQVSLDELMNYSSAKYSRPVPPKGNRSRTGLTSWKTPGVRSFERTPGFKFHMVAGDAHTLTCD